MEYISKTQAKKLTGFSYLGSVSMTTKHKKSLKYNELTYSLYLAPAKTSGYEVCPGRTAECSMFCLNESGMNTMTQKTRGDMINESRIRKTKLFFEHREFFMKWMIAEITTAQQTAINKGMTISVRLNNTSDIDPREFNLNGKNIMELFPDIMFYDYTKVKDRVELMNTYKNYDVTYSYTGYNSDVCQNMLKKKIKVAVVFKVIPETFMGYPVIDGDKYDMRYKDLETVVVGLKYKRVRAKLKPNIKFVVQ